MHDDKGRARMASGDPAHLRFAALGVADLRVGVILSEAKDLLFPRSKSRSFVAPLLGMTRGGADQKSLRTTRPPRMTNRTRARTLTSATGSPVTAIRSAGRPTSIVPPSSLIRRARAALIVADRIA